jgi:hypothetical protein
MQVRQCDHCKKTIGEYTAYINIALECDGGGPVHAIVSGLPVGVQGDFCSVSCVREKLNKYL